MRDEEDAQPAGLEVAEQVEHVDASRGVEHADDLVRDQVLDVQQERPSDQQPLELAAAELVRVLAQHRLGLEAHGVERRVQLAAPIRAAHPGEVGAADHAEDAVDLEDRVVRAEGILEDALHVAVIALQPPALEGGDVGPFERDRAVRDRRQPEDHLPDGRFPAAALADQGDDLAGPEIEGHVADRGQASSRRTCRSCRPS